MIGTFYNPFQDRQDTRPESHCARCFGELYQEDLCYLIGSQVYCNNCCPEDDAESSAPITGLELARYFDQMYGGSDDIE